MKKHAIYGPGLRFISVLHENSIVSNQYKITCQASDQHEDKLL